MEELILDLESLRDHVKKECDTWEQETMRQFWRGYITALNVALEKVHEYGKRD